MRTNLVAGSTPKMRLAGLDYWRAVLPVVGVFYHTLTRLNADSQLQWLEIIAFVPHTFRMEAFFALAGLLAGARLGGPGYLMTRWRILLLPACFVWILVVIQHPERGLLPFRGVDLHLWFLLTLAQLMTIAVCAERLGWIAYCLSHWRQTLLGCLLWAICARLCGTTSWTYPMALQDTTRLAIYYAPFLLAGIIVARVPQAAPSIHTARWFTALGFIISFLLALLCLLGEVTLPTHMGEDGGWSIVLTVIATLWVIGLLGTGVNRTVRPASAPVRWLADAGFTIYLVHFPVIALSSNVTDGLPLAVRFTSCMIVATVFPLAVHALALRMPLLRLLLNGVAPRSPNWLWQKRGGAYVAIGATSTLTSIAWAPEPRTTPSTGAISA